MMQAPRRPEIGKNYCVCNADFNFQGVEVMIVFFSLYKKVKAPTWVFFFPRAIT